MDNAVKIKKHRKVSLDSRKARAGYVFTLPFILGILLVYLPILVDSLWMSFHDIDRTGEVDRYIFNNFQYYKDAFISSNAFASNLLAGLQELVFEVPAVIIFSLFIAVVLNGKMLGRAAFRAILFVPVIISTGIMDMGSAMSEQLATDSTMNDGSGQSAGTEIVSSLDIEKWFEGMVIGEGLLTYVTTAINNIFNIVNHSGVQILIFLAGLQSISPAIYESVQIDGASAWETFWKITFPMISPMILVNAVYTVIDSFTMKSNVVMQFIETTYTSPSGGAEPATAMAWMYFLLVIGIIGLVAGICSAFIFYQRRD